MPRLGENVTRETNLDPDLMNILAGGSQIHRVITNLLCNAVDALLGIGHINVKTENYYADDVSGAYGHVPKGEYVKLTISDTGCGISDDIVQKILDPFFTTKTTDQKRGSGLGLSVVDAVVRDHNGYLDLKTQAGKGTSFCLYFPITRKSSDEDHSDKISGGSETILVVDDDDIQRDVSILLLNRLGYEVTSVESGEKAIEFLRENPHDLVILDMIMPGGIDGAETYKQVLEINPNQKAIIVSGFSESDRVEAAQRLGAGAFVKKPLTKKAIAVAVRTELDKKEEAVTA
jgi:CheY-like chemotaxis protein